MYLSAQDALPIRSCKIVEQSFWASRAESFFFLKKNHPHFANAGPTGLPSRLRTASPMLAAELTRGDLALAIRSANVVY